MIEDVYFHVPIEDAIVPYGSTCIVNSYWVVKDGSLIYYWPPSKRSTKCSIKENIYPQCNSCEATSTRLFGGQLRLAEQGYEIKHIPVVFEANVWKAAREYINEEKDGNNAN